MSQSPFLNQIRQNIRMRGYSIRTEKTYIYWIKDYIRYNHLKHPKDLAAEHVISFLSYLANRRDVAINTQKTALNALAYLYNQFLNQPLGDLGFTYAKRQRHLPVVLTVQEVQLILDHLSGRDKTIFSILYGSGLRITECLRLRVKDIDFQHGSITVRDGKGGKDRQTILSPALKAPLQALIKNAISLQQQDNIRGIGPSFPHMLGKNIRMLFGSQPGCLFFLQPLFASIQSQTNLVVITCTIRYHAKHYRRLCGLPV